MRVFQSHGSGRNTADCSKSSVAKAIESRSLADRIAQLNASVRREPHVAAGVVEYWLRKETC
jgi:hypothetical protein